MRKRKRTDIAWKYGTVVDDNVGHLRCNFCGHLMWGGVTRLKHHLAHIRGNVIPCRSCPQKVMVEIHEYLVYGSQKKQENFDGGCVQVNDARGGGNEEQLQEEQEYWQKLMGEIQEYLSNSTQKNKENIDGGGEQVNDMRSGGNDEQLQPQQEYLQKLVSDIEENLIDCSQKNIENIDGGSKQVNDMRGEGNEEQLQSKQECWRKSVVDDMFAYLFEETFRHGWEARNLEYEIDWK